MASRISGLFWGAYWKLRAFVSWFVRGLPSDGRSAGVGAGASWVASFLFVTYCSAQTVEFTTYPNERGFTKPMPRLVKMLDSDEQPTSISFDPATLEQVYVCEYAHVSAATARQALFSYVERYSACLSVRQRDDTTFIIKPNLKTGDLEQRGGNWFCKCAGVN